MVADFIEISKHITYVLVMSKNISMKPDELVRAAARTEVQGPAKETLRCCILMRSK